MRKCPVKPSKAFPPGHVKKGIDGRLWRCEQMAQGTRWVRQAHKVPSKARTKLNSRRSKNERLAAKVQKETRRMLVAKNQPRSRPSSLSADTSRRGGLLTYRSQRRKQVSPRRRKTYNTAPRDTSMEDVGEPFWWYRAVVAADDDPNHLVLTEKGRQAYEKWKRTPPTPGDNLDSVMRNANAYDFFSTLIGMQEDPYNPPITHPTGRFGFLPSGIPWGQVRQRDLLDAVEEELESYQSDTYFTYS